MLRHDRPTPTPADTDDQRRNTNDEPDPPVITIIDLAIWFSIAALVMLGVGGLFL